MPKYYQQEPIKVPKFEEANGFYTTKQRSEIMSRIRSKETKPEIMFRKALWACGVRYRKNVKKLPGSPDVVMRKYKIAVFIDGEFWHGYKWHEKKKQVKTNAGFWIPKIERNIQRDQENTARLLAMGYTVYRFWQDEVRKELMGCILQILSDIEHKERYP